MSASLPGMNKIDLPPIWLIFASAVAYFWRWPAEWSGAFWPGAFALLLAAGIMAGSAVEFLRARTTIIPRSDPSALITGGIYRVSRNPIYLADLLALFGVSLILGSMPGIVLVPFLGWVLEARFIRGEEARLEEAFGEAFRDYKRRTRRWI